MAKHVPGNYNPFESLPKKRQLSEPLEVAGLAPTQTANHLDGQTFKPLEVQLAKPLAKSQDPSYMKFTTYIPIELHRAVKVKVVGEGRELSDLVEQLLRNWNG